ncbi:unnamed protein product [Prunus armeniaca]
MGREIVRRESPNDPGRRSWLWRYEDVNYGTEAIESIVFRSIYERRALDVHAKSFSMMKRVKTPHYKVDLSDGLEYLPTNHDEHLTEL